MKFIIKLFLWFIIEVTIYGVSDATANFISTNPFIYWSILTTLFSLGSVISTINFFKNEIEIVEESLN